MMRLPRSLLCLLLPLLGAALRAGEAAPAINWVLPVFTDREGYRTMTLRGSQVQPLDADSIAVTDLSITVFSGDAQARVQTMFLSPLARFYRRENRASGDRSVRIIRDDLEASGQHWIYDHSRKHVTLDGDVRIVFNAQLKDILK